MAPLASLLVLFLAGITAAKQCTTFLIPVDIESRQGRFKEIPIENNLDVSAFALRVNRFNHNYTNELLEDYQTIKKSYNISAQWCKGSSKVIQLLTHGIGFDKTYWDLPYNNYSNSYVDVALEAGYSTLAIDRLGIGASSHGDPLNEIQTQLEVEALNAVTIKLRRGLIPQTNNTAYKKIIHVGHSFGSVQSYWLSALYPSNTDALILTGFSTVTRFLPEIVAGWNLHSARLNQPSRLGNASISTKITAALLTALKTTSLSPSKIAQLLTTTELANIITTTNNQYNYPPGYLANADLTSLSYVHLSPEPNAYDPALALAAEASKQPLTTGELLTIGTGPSSSPFSGPVLVLAGERDVPFCGGDCRASVAEGGRSILEDVKGAFPSVGGRFETHIVPGVGHAVALHRNVERVWEGMVEWLGNSGLGA